MGMSASQSRLLQLTGRKNNIGLELTTLSNEKMSLTRDMQKVSREYQQALNTKVLKWSNNNGVSYVDLSYDNLMKPSLMNQNKAYLLSDSDGKIVLDNSYKKYAEMLSPNGHSTNEWSGQKRLDILSSITGISADRISAYENYSQAAYNAKKELDELGLPPVNPAERNTPVQALMSKLDNDNFKADFDNHNNWACAYNDMDCGTITVNGIGEFKTLLKNLCNKLGNYLPNENEEGKLIDKAYDIVLNEYDGYFEDGVKIDSPDIGEKDGLTLQTHIMMVI